MKVLVACECSGTVRDAFIARGHDAWSCDLTETQKPGPHIKGDALDAMERGWDMMIAHPPCDYLTVSGNAWFKDSAKAGPGILTGQARRAAQQYALAFVKALWNAAIPRIAIENPIGSLSTLWMESSQTIQPWMFGHGETKGTCLWLRRLPLLQRTHRKDDLFCEPEPTEREQRLHKLPPSPTRKTQRSKTFQGIADAMAEQWGTLNRPR